MSQSDDIGGGPSAVFSIGQKSAGCVADGKPAGLAREKTE